KTGGCRLQFLQAACQNTIAKVQHQKGAVVEYLGVGGDAGLGFGRGYQVEAVIVPALFVNGELIGTKAGNRVSQKIGYLEQYGNFPRKGGELILNGEQQFIDRKSTRLNSSHVKISYAVFC